MEPTDGKDAIRRHRSIAQILNPHDTRLVKAEEILVYCEVSGGELKAKLEACDAGMYVQCTCGSATDAPARNNNINNNAPNIFRVAYISELRSRDFGGSICVRIQ